MHPARHLHAGNFIGPRYRGAVSTGLSLASEGEHEATEAKQCGGAWLRHKHGELHHIASRDSKRSTVAAKDVIRGIGAQAGEVKATDLEQVPCVGAGDTGRTQVGEDKVIQIKQSVADVEVSCYVDQVTRAS